MSAVYFTADTHFGHSNILKYEPEHRPFKSIEEHDEELIKRWNSVVRKQDLVWHLGDLFLGNDLDYFEHIMCRLNGEKVLLRGNHDTLPLWLYAKYFTNVLGVWPKYGAVLSHVPLHPDSLNRRNWNVNVHGHLHHNRVKYKLDGELLDMRYYCVSVEQHNLTPVSLEQIRKELGLCNVA